MKKIKHFLNTLDYSKEELDAIIELALSLKSKKIDKSVSGKILGMLFFNPSLRTRMSFASSMYKLGGAAMDLPIGANGTFTFEFKEGIVMDTNTVEHIKEAARLISRYSDVIAVRSSDLITNSKENVNVTSWEELKKDTVLQSFAKYATVPVINMESNIWHPCQGIGDALTIVEKFKNPKNKKYVLTWAYHPKALPMATPNSQILSACDLGMDVTVAYPKGWDLDHQIVNKISERSQKAGGSLTFTNSQEEAFKDADVICAKSWGALKYYGNWEEETKIKENLKSWIVDKQKMELTSNALFMHCLPVRRNVEVTDDVIDSTNSIVIDQAENRMWAQMAMLIKLLS